MAGWMRRHGFSSIRLAAAAGLTCCAATEAAAQGVVSMNHAEALTNVFQTICLIEAPDFDRLTARAKGMKLAPIGDPASKAFGPTTTKSRRWSGDLDSGPYVLRIEEIKGPDGIVTQCAIGDVVTDQAEFLTGAASKLQLSAQPSRVASLIAGIDSSGPIPTFPGPGRTPRSFCASCVPKAALCRRSSLK